jgi:hypothetical protein
MMLVKANEESEAGVLPSKELLTAMQQYNEELVRSGVMLAGDGLQPSSKGARVKRVGDNRRVLDGPFAETKELIAGYWLLQVKSRDEAIAWASRVPLDDGDEVELRQVFEPEDFPPELFTPEQADRERAMRDQLSGS